MRKDVECTFGILKGRYSCPVNYWFFSWLSFVILEGGVSLRLVSAFMKLLLWMTSGEHAALCTTGFLKQTGLTRHGSKVLISATTSAFCTCCLLARTKSSCFRSFWDGPRWGSRLSRWPQRRWDNWSYRHPTGAGAEETLKTCKHVTD